MEFQELGKARRRARLSQLRKGREISSTITIDDSFKKPGAVPFKWETRPGVPKGLGDSVPDSLCLSVPSGTEPSDRVQIRSKDSRLSSTEPLDRFWTRSNVSVPLDRERQGEKGDRGSEIVPKLHHQLPPPPPQQKQQQCINHHRSSCPASPIKLSPPPSGFYFRPPTPEPRARSRSNPGSVPDRSIHARPDTVDLGGCFPSPLALMRPKGDKKRSRRSRQESELEPDYTSELETLSRWSGSTRKSLSLFRDSPLSSSFSSYQSSPRPVSDAEWAWLGLF